MKIWKIKDLYVSLILILLSVVLITQLSSIQGEARYMPIFLLCCMLVFAVWIGVHGVVKALAKGKEDYVVDWSTLFKGIVIPGIFMLTLSLGLKFLGFYITSVLIVLFLDIIQVYVTYGKVPVNKKNILRWILFPLGTAILMYLLFGVVLRTYPPAGIFGF